MEQHDNLQEYSFITGGVSSCHYYGHMWLSRYFSLYVYCYINPFAAFDEICSHCVAIGIEVQHFDKVARGITVGEKLSLIYR